MKLLGVLLNSVNHVGVGSSSTKFLFIPFLSRSVFQQTVEVDVETIGPEEGH